MLHKTLAFGLEAKNRYDEAIGEYRETLKLDPSDAEVSIRLQTILMRQGRLEEARACWGMALENNPTEHAVWYGYAEFCLFLGREEEYRRARQTLLAKFGDITDPYIAERTSRACLLQPVSPDELRRIVVLAEHAWGVDRSKYPGVYPFFLFLRGLAEYRQGHLDQAITAMRGEASRVLGPAPRLVLSMALHQDRQTKEAANTLASAITSHDWRASKVKDQNDWIYHSLRREAEAIILPEMPAFLKGTYQPRNNDERLALLGVCQFTDRTGASAGLYAEAFAADPRLADDINAGHRYKAARAAALAGCASGEGSERLDDPERRRWRDQARKWLQADLAALDRAQDIDPVTGRDPLRRMLSQWRSEPDLAALREPTELGKLAADERRDWLTFWNELDLIGRSAGGTR